MFDKLVDLLVTWIRLLFFTFVLQPYQRGVVLRFGKLHRVVEPGFHWIWPFHVEVSHGTNVVPQTMKLEPQSLTTKDGKSIVVRAIVTFRIEDVEKYLLESEGAHQVIDDTVYGPVSSFVMDHTWDQLRSVTPVQSGEKEKILDADNEITKSARRLANKYGMDIMRVKFADCTLSRSIRLMQNASDNSHLIG